MPKSIKGWHFLYPGGRLRDGRLAPPDGEWLVHDGPIKLFEDGLYACERPLDVLKFAPVDGVLTRVELAGELVRGERTPDQVTGTRRRILWRLHSDATADLLTRFALWCIDYAPGSNDVAHFARRCVEGKNVIESAMWAAYYAVLAHDRSHPMRDTGVYAELDAELERALTDASIPPTVES